MIAQETGERVLIRDPELGFAASGQLSIVSLERVVFWTRRYWSSKKMVLLTMIARVADGLPLAASMQEDEQVSVRYTVGFFPFLSTQDLIFD